MDALKDVVAWIVANWDEILKALGALYAALLIIVKLTKTPKDDEALSKVSGFVLKIAAFFGIKK